MSVKALTKLEVPLCVWVCERDEAKPHIHAASRKLKKTSVKFSELQGEELARRCSQPPGVLNIQLIIDKSS